MKTVETLQERRLCLWCKGEIPAKKRVDSRFCSQRCRQSSHRFSVEKVVSVAQACPMRFAYADPPYPGKAFYYPENAEVDHADLVARLRRDFPDGWGLSTSAEALLDVWKLCPEARLHVWVRSHRNGLTRRAAHGFEALLVAGGRKRHVEDTRDLVDVLIYSGRHRSFPGALVGMKPPAFAEWLFRLLGADVGDTFTDMFSGSGSVSESWSRFIGSNQVAMKLPIRRGSTEVSPTAGCDVSHPPAGATASRLADPRATCR